MVKYEHPSVFIFNFSNYQDHFKYDFSGINSNFLNFCNTTNYPFNNRYSPIHYTRISNIMYHHFYNRLDIINPIKKCRQLKVRKQPKDFNKAIYMRSVVNFQTHYNNAYINNMFLCPFTKFNDEFFININCKLSATALNHISNSRTDIF